MTVAAGKETPAHCHRGRGEGGKQGTRWNMLHLLLFQLLLPQTSFSYISGYNGIFNELSYFTGGDDADNISSGPMSIRDLNTQLLPVHYPHADNPYQIPSVPRDTSQVRT